MDCKKYIGMDVHQANISIAVRDATGKVVVESIIETKAATILGFIRGIQGSLWIIFEEGTSAAWLYDLLKPHVHQSDRLRSAEERSAECGQYGLLPVVAV